MAMMFTHLPVLLTWKLKWCSVQRKRVRCSLFRVDAHALTSNSSVDVHVGDGSSISLSISTLVSRQRAPSN